MNAIEFRRRWDLLLTCHHEIQDEPLLRPIEETDVAGARVLTYAHNNSSGWAVAFHPEGTLVKAYDLDEITPFTFEDVRPQFVLPRWAYEIYTSDVWRSEHTTSFRYCHADDTEWEAPWLALPWLPIDAHALLEPTESAVLFWADWFGRPELASSWIDRVSK